MHFYMHSLTHILINTSTLCLQFSNADTVTAIQLCGKEEALTKQGESIHDNYNSLLNNYTVFTLLSGLPPLIFTKIFTAAGTQV